MSKLILLLVILLASCASTKETSKSEIASMPRFTFCKEEPNNTIAQDKCSRNEMGIYINEKLVEYSGQYNIGGFTDDFVITFKVRSNGELIDIEAHKGTDKDLKRVMIQIFKAMKSWVPAYNVDGKTVSVRLAIPITIVRGKIIPS
jgi:hypothetical protein